MVLRGLLVLVLLLQPGKPWFFEDSPVYGTACTCLSLEALSRFLWAAGSIWLTAQFFRQPLSVGQRLLGRILGTPDLILHVSEVHLTTHRHTTTLNHPPPTVTYVLFLYCLCDDPYNVSSSSWSSYALFMTSDKTQMKYYIQWIMLYTQCT